MVGKARLGQRVLVAVTVSIVLAEIIVALVSWYAGGLRRSQFGRVSLTVWLLFEVWEGKAWARWVLTVLSSVTAILAIVVGSGSLALGSQKAGVGFIVALGIYSAAIAVGLVSPWVGAYQAARRDSSKGETRTGHEEV